MIKRSGVFIFFFHLSLLFGCSGVPEGVQPVEGFQLEKYLGKWYEIARLENRFEAGLTGVTAQYSLREDGGIDVLNRGFDPKSNQWQQAKGKAYFMDSPEVGHLKVSFFGPFYSSYIIFELDESYEYAFVSGYKRDFLWLLAREPEVSPQIQQKFLNKASGLGFDLTNLVEVSHDQNP